MKKKFLFYLICALLVGIALAFVFLRFIPYKGYYGSQIIHIEKKSSISKIAKLLAEKKVIPSAWGFRIYQRIFAPGVTFRSGDYKFDTVLTIPQLIEKLREGKVMLIHLTIKEGLNWREMIPFVCKDLSISPDDFTRSISNVGLVFDIDPSATDLEGYLYPETYLIHKDIQADELIKEMVDQFKSHFPPSCQDRARSLGLSVRQVVTLASLIEKETASRDERFLISSVFHNRLKKGMSLDCDPTVVYALLRENRYHGKLGWDDLKFDSLYNTRMHRGLPPGPICNPSLASIEAALQPDNTKFYYFVSKDGRSHYFSETLDEHNHAVHQFIINRSPSRVH